MATKVISWGTGTGSITVTYNGDKDGTISVVSDPNNLYEARSKIITVKTTDGSNIQKTVTIQQAAKVRIDLSTAVVTAAAQTYSGSAKTPTPTVTLNGDTVPSSGYDVAYSNNTNAGTATITVTGKGEYTGTATGTFTINKASRTLSFADTYAVVAPSGNVTKTATPSAGSGDGAITYSISSTTYATINSSSGKVTAKTSEGSAVVTATIAEGTNYLSATASYNLYVFATTHNFAYTGSVQNIALPPGSYKLQCWGAQGGSNAADSTYDIVAKTGGKGGYAEGVLTIAEQLTLYAFVGGQGGASGNGGWNCGGGGIGSTTNTSGDTTHTTRYACGGGATDFALVTSSMSYSSRRNNRSDASLLSRIIVAGGGSGGAMGCKRSLVTTTEWQLMGTLDCSVAAGTTGTFNGHNTLFTRMSSGTARMNIQGNPFEYGTKIRITINNAASGTTTYVLWTDTVSQTETILSTSSDNPRTYTHNYSSNPFGDSAYYRIQVSKNFAGTITIEKEVTVSSYTNEVTSQEGYVGGGVNGDGFVGTYDFRGKQDAPGQGGAFGKGASRAVSSNGYCSGCGGAGWYGGGANNGTTDTGTVEQSGGGSGFVNTAANAQYRPTGYTGIELDSGSTTAGSSSFPSTGGGTETGHSGNGYARITRL